MESHKEGMAHILQQDITFGHDMFDFIPSYDGFLLEDFDGIALVGLFVSC